MTMRRYMMLVEGVTDGVMHIDALPTDLHTHATAMFEKLAKAQRDGDPEKLGGATLYNKGIHVSGLYAGLTEHVGDITNRMAKEWDFYKGSFLNCRDKVEMGLRRAGPEIQGQVERNYQFQSDPERDEEHKRNPAYSPRFAGSLGDWIRWWHEAGGRYADAHAKLVVWNEAQWNAREAAVAAGRIEFARCRRHLEALQRHMDDNTAWVAYAGQVTVRDGVMVSYSG